MEFEILGPLVVRAGGAEVALGAAKPRALLVRLLLAAGRPVPAERLVEDLWESDPPRSAAQTLQTYVSQLRKALGADRVVTVAGGYRLVVEGDEVDSTRFEAEVATARGALDHGDARAAIDALGAALARWRGPALLDAAGAAWAEGETTRLEELRLVATEMLLEARLAVGDHAGVIGAAESAVADHPLRERMWALLMTALYRHGRQADALRAYQRLRQHLGDELGIDPSRELQDLEARMLRQEADLDVRSAGGRAEPRRALPTGVVTFLLTDVVGSTRLWESSAAAMADAVARHDELLREIVDAHHGVLLKARGEGDSSFSVFQRATDAVAAAAAARDRLAAEPWPTPGPLEVRMALHTGEAVERDGDYYGRSVNRAARLRGAAPPGQVVVSQATAEVVVDDLPDGHRLVHFGVQQLRDLERPETVFVVAPVGEAVTAPGDAGGDGNVGLPLPGRLATSTSGFVGRGAERDVLDAALKATDEGTARVVLVAGEPGIGKTTLAAELARRAQAAGATVLYGRCDDDAGVPYRPWLEALGHLVAFAPTTVLDRLSPRQRADLSRLVPAVVDRDPSVSTAAPGDPDADRWAVFAAVAALVGAAAVDAPVVLVVDDLQWADKPSLHLLRHVVDSARSERLLVVATYRDRELAADDAVTGLLAELRRDPGAERLVLRGLDDRDVVELVEGLTGQPLGPDAVGFVHALRRETDGNPFFTTELLRHLAETGAVYLDDAGRWVPRAELDDAGLPDSVREVVGRRIRNLGEGVEQVLRAAAVIGQEFDLPTLVGALGTSAAGVLDAVELAEAAGLVASVAPERFSFAHALVAHTLYADLTPTRRSQLHRLVAEAVESSPGADARAGELARHWAAAMAPGDVAKAVAYARQAGDAALRALAPDEAVRWYAQAVELLGPSGEDRARCDLLVRLGRAQRGTGEMQYRRTLLDAAQLARAIGDVQLLARAALASSRGFIGSIDDEYSERVEVLETALAACDRDDSVVRARLLGTLAAELRGRGTDRCRELSDEALVIARRLGEPRLLVATMNLWFFANWLPSTLEERLALSEEAIALAEEVGDELLLHWTANWRVHALMEVGDAEGASTSLDQMSAIAEETGHPSVQWTNLAYRAAHRAVRGDVDEAERLASSAVERAGTVAELDARSVRASVGVLAATHRGTLSQDLDRLEREAAHGGGGWFGVAEAASVELAVAQAVVGRADAAGRAQATTEFGTPRFSGVTAALAVAQAGAGRGDAARRALATIELGTPRFSGITAALAEACVLVGTAEQARQLLEGLEPYRAQVGTTGVTWTGSLAFPVAILHAHLGEADEADRAFAEAEAMNERLGAPFFLARTRVAWAGLLRHRGGPGDAERASELLALALRGAREHGCAGIEREVEALLAVPPPLPARLVSDRALVGRGDELERVQRATALALVAGEPGIGKSALVAAAARAAHEGGALVLHGRCDEDLRVPYHPFVDALTSLVTDAPDAVLDAIGDRQLAELVRLVPAVADRRPSLPAPQPTDPETERYLFMNAAVAALAETARRGSLVLVIDDLHWADKPTIVLLRHLVAEPPAGVTVLGTYRHTDLFRDAPLADALPSLRRVEGAEHVILGGLSADDLQALTGADHELAAALHRETDGNPFFASELHRHVRDTGGDITAGRVPDAVRGLVRQRVAGLGEDVRSTLTVAAAIGQEFELALVESVVGDDIDALDAIERAEGSALVTSIAPERFAFAHALVQHALYDDLTPTRRVRLHRQLAEALAGSDRVAELARHWTEAAVTPEDIATAVGHATAAGDEASRALAPDEAARWFGDALGLLVRLPSPDDAQRLGLLLRLARAQQQAGDPTFRRTRQAAAELADRLGDVDAYVQAALTQYMRAYAGYEEDPDKKPLLERALELIGDAETPERARLLGRYAYELTFLDPLRHTTLADEAIALARRVGDRAALVEVIAARGLIGVGTAVVTDGQLQREALALAEEMGDPALIFDLAQTCYTLALLRTDRAESRRCIGLLQSAADQLRRPDLVWLATALAGDSTVLDGDLATAEEMIERAYAIGRESGQPGAEAYYVATLQSIRWHQGRHGEVAARVADASQRTPSLAVMQLPVSLGGAEPSGLRELVESIPRDGGFLLMTSIVGDLIARAGDREAAALLHEMLSPHAHLWAGAGPMNRGANAHTLGVLARVLGRLDDADAHFRAAAAMNERMQAPFFTARTQVEHAKLLLERDAPGDGERAIELLVQARATAAARGYAQIERRAVRLLDG